MNYSLINSKSLHDYYEAISTFPRVTTAMERRLAATIQDARQEEENAIREQREPDSHILQVGRQARTQLIEANLRLVVHVVKNNFNQINTATRNVHFAPSQQLQSMTRFDLIEAGNLGLITAVDSFDANRDNTFSTYATKVIKNAILSAIYNEDRLIRLPAYKENEVRQASKSIEGTMEYLTESVLHPISIDAPITFRSPQMADFDLTIDGILSETDEAFATSPIDTFITDQDRYELVHSLLEILTPEERSLAIALFVEGIKDAEIARQLEVSRVRIGQRKKAIQAKLKAELDRRHISFFDIFG